MRREAYALFTDSGNKFKALICVFAPVFVRVSVLYTHVLMVAAAAVVVAGYGALSSLRSYCYLI